MRGFKILWETHKWIGVALGLLLVLTAGTGFLLLVKKEFAWIQPPTQRGQEAPSEDLLSLQDVYERVFALGLPELRAESDIDRIDFRPGKRVHKVRAKEGLLEVQVDAVSGAILSVDRRNSDWIESLHDGSVLGDWVHDFVFPIAALGLGTLACTGYLIWLWPKWKKRRRQRASA